jgi:hypothetical protein
MPRSRAVWLIVAIAAGISTTAFSALATESAIRAPVQCSCAFASLLDSKKTTLTTCAPSCGSDLSIDRAQKSYDKVEQSRKKSCSSIKAQELTGACSPLKTLTDEFTCGSHETIGLYYYWAPVEEFQDGIAALKKLTDAARSGKPFNNHLINRG